MAPRPIRPLHAMCTCLLLACFLSDVSGASQVTLVDGPETSLNPSQWTVVGEQVFVAGAQSEQELWSIRDTSSIFCFTSGTSPLRTIKSLVAFRGRLWFGAGEHSGRVGLWVSDGTAAGTRLAVELAGEGAEVRAPGNFIAVGSLLYFTYADEEHGRELWVSDGTPEGTRMVQDLNPGSGNGVGLVGLYQDRLVLQGNDGSGDQLDWKEYWEPYISDGTAAGTQRLADCWPGLNGSEPTQFTTSGNRLYFTAVDSLHGRELWTSDGTAAGTHLVADLKPGVESLDYFWFAGMGDERIVFAADDGVHGRELWVSDGSGANTQMIADLAPGENTSGQPLDGAGLFEPVLTADGLVFTRQTYDLDKLIFHHSFAITNGTLAGTDFLGPTPEGAKLLSPGLRSDLALANGQVFGVLRTAETGAEPWRYDLESGELSLVADALPDTGNSNPVYFTQAGDRLYWSSATDKTVNGSRQPWTLSLPPAGQDARPSIDAPASLTGAPGSLAGPITLTVDDDRTPLHQLQIGITIDRTEVLDPEAVQQTGTGGQRQLAFPISESASGSASVTLTVYDHHGYRAHTDLVLSVDGQRNLRNIRINVARNGSPVMITPLLDGSISATFDSTGYIFPPVSPTGHRITFEPIAISMIANTGVTRH